MSTGARAGGGTNLVSHVNSAAMVHPRDKTRIRILKRDKGLCQECLRRGAITEATCVDHVRALAHGGDDSDANLESLCTPCHSAKTARERLSGGQGGG